MNILYAQIDREGYIISTTDSVVDGYIQIDGDSLATGVRNRLVNGKIIHEPFDTPYTLARLQAYPPIGDQLDALWKLITANRDKLDLGQSEQLLDMVQAVKEKYPKPSE